MYSGRFPRQQSRFVLVFRYRASLDDELHRSASRSLRRSYAPLWCATAASARASCVVEQPIAKWLENALFFKYSKFLYVSVLLASLVAMPSGCVVGHTPHLCGGQDDKADPGALEPSCLCREVQFKVACRWTFAEVHTFTMEYGRSHESLPSFFFRFFYGDNLRRIVHAGLCRQSLR